MDDHFAVDLVAGDFDEVEKFADVAAPAIEDILGGVGARREADRPRRAVDLCLELARYDELGEVLLDARDVQRDELGRRTRVTRR